VRLLKTQTLGMVLPALYIFLATAHAQGLVEVNWMTKTLVSYPQIVNSRLNTIVVVTGVNDLLYNYQISVVATPQVINDASNLLAIGAAATQANQGQPQRDPCSMGVTALNTNVSKISDAIVVVFDPSSKVDSNKKLRSVPLAETIAAWNTQVKAVVAATLNGEADVVGSLQYVGAQCTVDPGKSAAVSPVKRAEDLLAIIAGHQKQIDGPHQIQQGITLAPENDYTVTVTEFANGTQTAQFTQKFSPTSTILTLSLGALLSEIQQRSYVNTKDPANTQENLLSVNGTGKLSPLGVALLNYEIPEASNDTIGLALSSGPVLRFGGGQVSASALGWFGGLSVHLYHRFYVSAGVHVGQFTDFPPGLASGSVVPANYGNLTGQTRSTARFAFAVTYQTKSFSSGTKPAAATTTTSSAPAPSSTPSPAPGSTPSKNSPKPT